ncbi:MULTISPECIES: preprotein translocase subunit SecE [Corynebacterium]|uniref:Protein translocase subunit SecE n=1 Tax=[Brevibacterium] flavum TaxID=92706 RepID=A0A0F6Z4B2_9CORY|nr:MULTISPECIES: preprotein translocase subunit SecE [Corynebacterium]AJE66523.1 preprotein translocase subunit SecE [Corynebacterium glutamicum]AKF26528.1 preprotein translocase subunit SecE [[Brevibacterium] flavum]ANE07349.1 preprotein translocase subunit SecE [Corynebacterium glutamicum]AST19767.1 preprotein translocase subunit SecE [Corynebacterium glutamicum ATCC 14067]KEI22223.1 preprotein translocase subunit SecE [Corynebacterium glutamicum ATCC 14067]
MSDEQNSGVGGTSRPTGKRQLSGASTTSTSSYEAKQVSTQKKSSDSDSKPGGGVVSFLPEVVGEVRKVIWPTARQMVTYTLVVLGFLIVLTALVSGVDFLAGLGVEKILTP